MTKPSVFVAHSSLDIDDAHIIRNLLEDRKHDVLVLKLAQQMKDDDLEQLIREEIKARDWLVMLRSENAKNSRWVPFEEAYARFHRKPIFHVEQEKCAHLMRQERIECFEHQVRAISRDIRIFMSYSRQDRKEVMRIDDDLTEAGYEIWKLEDHIGSGQNFVQVVGQAIHETLQDGYMIVFMSEASITSSHVLFEVSFAPEYPGRIIPCLLGSNVNRLPSDLAKLQFIDFANQPYDDAFEQLLKALGWEPQS